MVDADVQPSQFGGGSRHSRLQRIRIDAVCLDRQALAADVLDIRKDAVGIALRTRIGERQRLAPPGALLSPRQCHGYRLSPGLRSEEHTSELQSLMRISYAVFCLKKKKQRANIRTKSINQRNIQTRHDTKQTTRTNITKNKIKN